MFATVDAAEIVVRERWLFRRRTERAALHAVSPRIVDGKDSEGDAYFRLVVAMPSGHRVTIAEGNDRPVVETELAKLEAAIAAAR